LSRGSGVTPVRDERPSRSLSPWMGSFIAVAHALCVLAKPRSKSNPSSSPPFLDQASTWRPPGDTGGIVGGVMAGSSGSYESRSWQVLSDAGHSACSERNDALPRLWGNVIPPQPVHLLMSPSSSLWRDRHEAGLVLAAGLLRGIERAATVTCCCLACLWPPSPSARSLIQPGLKSPTGALPPEACPPRWRRSCSKSQRHGVSTRVG